RADEAFDLAYLEYIIRNDAVLPAAGFDDCEHRLIPSCSIPSSGLRPGRLLVQSVMGTCSARSGVNPLSGITPCFRAKTSGAGNPAPVGGLYSGKAPGVKANRHEKPPNMRDLARFRLPPRQRRAATSGRETNGFHSRCPPAFVT